MNIYKIKFQIGDIVLYSKEIPVSTITKTNCIKAEPLNILPQDEVDLPQYLPQLSIIPELVTKKMTVQNNKLYYIRSVYNNFFIDLSDYDSFADYLTKFSKKSRATLKRKVRKAEKEGFSYKIYQHADEVDEFHLHACAVGEHTYQNRLFNSSIPNDEDYKAQMKNLAEKDAFLGLILFKDNKPCAYLYLPIIEDVYIYAYLGYIQEFSKFSPGTILQFYAFEKIFDEKLKASYFDFTEGDGQHKEFFATDKRICCNCLVFEKTFSIMFLLKTQMMFDAFSGFLGKILDKYNLRAKIKKIIRRA
jgi:hypothetical protein